MGDYQSGDKAEPQPLTDKTYIDACVDDSVILRGTFSQSLKKDTQLLFFMEYLEVHIYLNGDEIYAWGTEETHPSFMRSAGAAWGYCVLPVAVSQKDEITISLESKYTNNYNSAYHDFLDSLQIGDSGALVRAVLMQNWPYLLAGLLLFLIGLTLQLFVLALARQNIPIHTSVYYCAFFILSASLWIVINPMYSTLVFKNPSLIMLLETISMWLFSTFLCGYFGTFMRSRAKRANELLLFGFVFTLVAFLILQLFGMTDAYAIRDIHNVYLGMMVVAFLFIFRYEVHHVKKSELKTLALPGILYVMFDLIEMLNYQYEWLPRGGAVTVGFSIFIMAQFVLAVRQMRNNLRMALKAAQLEKDLAESRTAALFAQIQPHFLYNTLNSIKALCGSNPKNAEDAIGHFAYFLRNNLDALSHTQFATFDNEITHVKNYVYLEKMRFQQRVNLVLELEYEDFLLPPLTLQPLVENAIRYGITKKNSGGTVIIRSRKQEGQVVILIADDGVGFDVTTPKSEDRSHIGIENVRSRLKLQCGGSLEVTSKEGVGTEVRITLPEEENLL